MRNIIVRHSCHGRRPKPAPSSLYFPFSVVLFVLVASIHSAMFVSSRPLLNQQSCHMLMDCNSCVETSHRSCSWCPHNGNCVNTTKSKNEQTSNIFDSCPGNPINECSSSSSSSSSNSAIFSDGVQTLESPDNDSLDNFFGDVNYAQQQWVFDMINLGPVWEQGIFGTGVRVRVNDDGVDGNNIEFQGRFDTVASCDNEEMYLAQSARQHGTSVASIIGAAADNTECTVGVAPQVRLSSCYALQPDESFLAAKIDQMDISQNSYERPACPYAVTNGRRRATVQGCPFTKPSKIREDDPCLMCDFTSTSILTDICKNAIVKHCKNHYEDEKDGCSDYLDLIIGGACSYVGLSDVARDSIVRGINEGRGGLGIIYVFASGNTYFEGDYTTLKGYTNTRFTITVGAVGKDRKHAYYSTPGASLFVSAPGADREDRDKHYTAQVGGGCRDAGMGTSFAAPVVSGVVALVLQANPTLGWRDVQGILAESATPILDFTEEEADYTVATNGAGFWHSNLYGFGLVNAAAAVALAKTWTNYGPEQMISVDSGVLDYPIVDDIAIATTSILTLTSSVYQPNVVMGQPSDPSLFVIEAVELLLDISHFSRGDLKVVLTSPSGTTSVMHPGKLPENMQSDSDEFWNLLTVRNWGESPFGEWKLSITDEKVGHLSECVDMAGFSFYYGTVEVDCLYLASYGICMDGDYSSEFFGQGNYQGLKVATDDQGRTMTSACCACGGGLGRSSFDDKLRHWTLAVYGRLADIPEVGVDSPSSNPTTLIGNTKIATLTPTILVSPSQPPLATPTLPPSVVTNQYSTIAPTLRPSTTAPTSTPTVTTSSAPSGRPSLTTSNTPSLIVSSTPSSMPSSLPSSNPSIPPTSTPSISIIPSYTPSILPSSMPSIPPSTVPSDSPSTRPSATSSDSPSRPTSDMPTAAVSSMPSSKITPLTSTPSISTDPVGFPSALPSSSPSPSLDPAEPPRRDDLNGLSDTNAQGTASDADDNNNFTSDTDNGSHANSAPLPDPCNISVVESGSMSDDLKGEATSFPSSPPALRTSNAGPVESTLSSALTTRQHFQSVVCMIGCFIVTAII
jgi:hypothetical protein